MYLLDTNVISELRKVQSGLAHPQVSQWAARTIPAELYLSAITIQELELGVRLAERKNPPQGLVLRTWLTERVLPAFQGRILPVDEVVAVKCAELHIERSRPLADSLLAATALVHGLILVTRNVADMAGCGVSLLNPWEEGE